ncbi:hypothetical protein NP233_g3245 [Leucocoprinus birnbaumii]|uniref:Glutathione hydrolase n=1 Tax=Leucocoprinus birnbaumii TaxID=56174 RepID=A0AAD5VWX4_9AGAR|nr:hypothetical protein NP233_g3245 [Leucocoprinus birnbaumii]
MDSERNKLRSKEEFNDVRHEDVQVPNAKRKWPGAGFHERVVVAVTTAGLVLLAFWWCSYGYTGGQFGFLFGFSPVFHCAVDIPVAPAPDQSFDRFYREYPDDPATIIKERPRNPAYLIKAYRGAVATENGVCSSMGVDVLKKGGNAVDAAISAALCIGVVNMFSSGIGGGGFMVVRIPPSNSTVTSNNTESEVWSLNFREAAPAASNSTMFQDDPMKSRWGGLAVAIPGELRGLQEAHNRWGTIPWKDLVEPSAKLAAGWRVHPELERRIQLFAPLMLDHPDWRPIFAPNGRLLKEGDWIYRTNYSRTLQAIAEHGSDAFYQGPIADSMVKKVHQTGGILSHEDLNNYRIRVEKPLAGTYRGRKIYTTAAPGGGSLLLQMLNVLENYDMPERTPLAAHRIVETMKFAFASRTKMCDPKTKADRVRISNMVTEDYAQEILRNITDDSTHPPEYYNPEFDVPMDHGTSHTSVVDQNGMAVSLTTTVNSVFGSLVLDPITGIILNDEMDDFSVPGTPNDFGLYPSPYNYPEPGKLPMSSTSPAILENSDGSFYASIGGSGGGRIFTSVVQVLLNLDWGLHASEAIEFGRVHDQLYPLKVDVDEIYPSDAVEYLRHVGHNVSLASINRIAGIVHVVMQKDGILQLHVRMDIPLPTTEKVKSLNVEESRAKRLERQQARLRDRGGIFRPENRNNNLFDILIQATHRKSPAKGRGRTRSRSVSPQKKAATTPNKQTKPTSSKSSTSKRKSTAAMVTITEISEDDAGAQPRTKKAKGKQKRVADVDETEEDQSKSKKAATQRRKNTAPRRKSIPLSAVDAPTEKTVPPKARGTKPKEKWKKTVIYPEATEADGNEIVERLPPKPLKIKTTRSKPPPRNPADGKKSTQTPNVTAAAPRGEDLDDKPTKTGKSTRRAKAVTNQPVDPPEDVPQPNITKPKSRKRKAEPDVTQDPEPRPSKRRTSPEPQSGTVEIQKSSLGVRVGAESNSTSGALVDAINGVSSAQPSTENPVTSDDLQKHKKRSKPTTQKEFSQSDNQKGEDELPAPPKAKRKRLQAQAEDEREPEIMEIVTKKPKFATKRHETGGPSHKARNSSDTNEGMRETKLSKVSAKDEEENRPLKTISRKRKENATSRRQPKAAPASKAKFRSKGGPCIPLHVKKKLDAQHDNYTLDDDPDPIDFLS